MIVRTWRGAVRAADADRYLQYLNETGLPEYRTTPGNLGAMAWCRIEGDRCEFVTVSFWTRWSPSGRLWERNRSGQVLP